MIYAFAKVEIRWMRGDAISLDCQCSGARSGTGVQQVGQAARSVERHAEVASKGWAKGSRPSIWVDLETVRLLRCASRWLD